MSGLVAAGNPATAEAAKEILARGGNAVDAAVAACFAAFVAEPLLASAGGGGLLLASLPDREPVAVDFFPHAPGLAGPVREADLDFVPVEVNFGPARQTFHVGRGTAAAPLALPGLALAAKEFGTLPLCALAAPAVSLAETGVRVTRETADVFALLRPILARDQDTCALYSVNGHLPHAGDTLYMPQLAASLEAFAARQGFDAETRLLIAEAFGPVNGGQLTMADLAAAVPRIVSPRKLHLGEYEIFTSPHIGGGLVAHIARRIAELEAAHDTDHSEHEAVRLVARASREGHAARADYSLLGGTTHISVADGRGGVASVTLTNGEGCGHLIPGTGIQMNNFLGEEDLNPRGFHQHAAGDGLPTMIAPTLARGPGGLFALGSGGANRIRSVVAQVLRRALRGDSLSDAVLAPRVHAEDEQVWIELADRSEPEVVVEALEQVFEQVHTFDGRAFFFGGVQIVTEHADGRLEGFADPRRGGAVR